MARTPRWTEHDEDHGIFHVRLSSWHYFDDYIRQEMLDYSGYVWRGQRRAPWPLQSTLDRAITKMSKRQKEETTRAHVRNFQFGTRGRRGNNPPVMEHDNDWWALGQHHGLKTPLLDWTVSPFVAAYFAFVGEGPDQSTQRAIFALDEGTVTTLSTQIADAHSQEGRAPIMEFVRPRSDENARLVNQGGLFTRAPTGMTIEDWMRAYIPADHRTITLLKMTIPNKDRHLCLRSLNRMNINHLTLFPDLYGASKHCNADLAIKDY